MNRSTLRTMVLSTALVAVVWGGDAPPSPTVAPAVAVPVAGTAPAKPKESVGPFSQFAEEEKWIFDPQVTRLDVFYDLEALMAAQIAISETVKIEVGPTPNQNDELAVLRDWAKVQLSRIETLVLARKWDEAIRATEPALKRIQLRVNEDPALAQIAEKIKRYGSQAEEAKILEEAQAKFDALGLRVEGILWSPAGSLAVISGEPRARAMNERVKDCVIINIDTNRVDFLFHYNRRRFEFQRYVGEDATSGKTK